MAIHGLHAGGVQSAVQRLRDLLGQGVYRQCMPAGASLGAYWLMVPDLEPELGPATSHDMHAGGAWECTAAPARCVCPERARAIEKHATLPDETQINDAPAK